MLSDYRIARQAQFELDQSFLSKASLSIEELEDLVILPAIGAESMRLSLLATPPDVLYKITEDIWYQKFFLPKNSLIVFDRNDIFPNSTKLSDGQVLSERLSLMCSSVLNGTLSCIHRRMKLMKLLFQMARHRRISSNWCYSVL